MITRDLLREYIQEIFEEMRNSHVPNQLRDKDASGKSSVKSSDKKKDAEEVDEMSVVANIVGYTAPLGASSADVGKRPTRPGGRLRKNKKDFVRWK